MRELLGEEGASLWERVSKTVSDGARDRAALDALVLDVLRWQRKRCGAIDRAMNAMRDGGDAERVDDVVGVPTDAFKTAQIACFDVARAERVFRTSGTTRELRGAHALPSMALYEQTALSSAKRWLLPEREYAFAFFAEPESESPHSSLSAMLAMFARAWSGDVHWAVRDGALDVAATQDFIARAISQGKPIAALGATFAFVHLADADSSWRARLPAGSVVMPTGGLKGRARAIAPEALMALVRETFGVERTQIVQEYGMTELSSQGYEAHAEGLSAGRYAAPKWMMVDAVDADSLRVLPKGERGVLRVIDLCNVGSCVAIQTSDEGTVYDDGFEVHGRIEGATPRGCGRAMDALLSGDR